MRPLSCTWSFRWQMKKRWQSGCWSIGCWCRGCPQDGHAPEGGQCANHFTLVSIAQIDHQKFLSSNKPEEIIFAVLGNFGEEPPEKVAMEVVTQLQRSSPDRLAFQKHLQQLRVLINLRKLKPFIDTIVESITQFMKPEEDYLYKKGFEKGFEKEKHEMIARLVLKTDLSNEQIAEIANVPVGLVEKIREGQGR
jgi:hypothetical protein